MSTRPSPEEIWSAFLGGGVLASVVKTRRRFFQLFPARHRCKNCSAPFEKVGAWLMPLIGHGRYGKNPRFCRF